MYIYIYVFFNIYIYVCVYMYIYMCVLFSYIYIYVRVCHAYLISPPNGWLSTQIDAQQTLNHHRPGGGWWSDIRNAPRFLNDSKEPSGNDVYSDDVHLVVHPKEVTITKIFLEHKGIPWLGMMYMTLLRDGYWDGKTIGKPQENGGFNGKTIGKP